MKDNLTGSLTSNHLTTVQQVLENLGSSASINNASVSGTVYRFIGEVSSRFESKVFRPLRVQSFIGEYNGCGNNELILRNTPIVSVTSIKYRENLSSDWQTLNNAFVINYHKIIMSGYIFTTGINNYQVTYTAGYSPIPMELQELANDAVFIKVKESNIIGGLSDGRLGQNSRQAEGVKSFSTSFKDLRNREDDILCSYTKINVY